jgi:hypothetical protein
MQMKTLLFPFLILLGLIPIDFPKAASHIDIVINEIAWMGTNTSYSDEWIELYNNTNSSVSLENWALKAIDGTPEINLSGIILANGFFLLERTDDTTIPNITADQIYAGTLSNNGEHLQLFDNQNNLIDEVNCANSWFAGDNANKQTMERVSPILSNWQTSENPLGTPKTINNVFTQQEPELEQESIPKPNLTQEPKQQINEILPSPEGPDSENEWIELFNKNDFSVDLSNWKIKDSIGTVTTYIFPENTTIKNKGYLVILRPETKIILNNDADSLSLIQPNNKIIDIVSYKKAPRRESYSLTNSGWYWSQELTSGKANLIRQPDYPKDTKVILKEASSGIKQNDILKKDEKMLASVLKKAPESSNDSSGVFLIALSIAIFSGIVIWILKKTISKKVDFQ